MDQATIDQLEKLDEALGRVEDSYAEQMLTLLSIYSEIKVVSACLRANLQTELVPAAQVRGQLDQLDQILERLRQNIE